MITFANTILKERYTLRDRKDGNNVQVVLQTDNNRSRVIEVMSNSQRNRSSFTETFAELCTQLEIADAARDQQAVIIAENQLREFYANCSEEERQLLEDFLREMDEADVITEGLRMKFHERFAQFMLMPLKLTNSIVRNGAPIVAGIVKASAEAFVASLRGLIRGGTAGWKYFQNN